MNRKTKINKIAVIGGGSWGTSLANLLATKGMDVCLWVREEEALKQIREERTNRIFLPDIKLDQTLNVTGEIEEAIAGKELVLMVIPSHVFRDVLEKVKNYLKPDMKIMAATKGIENESLMIMSKVAEEILSKSFMKKYASLGGPSFAREVGKGYPTAVTIACKDSEHGKKLQRLFSTNLFRAYISHDLIGVQLGGALKNIIAIGAGAADGLSFGSNARAALITRGLAEITRLGVEMGANPHTFAGLAGMGDLVLTCTGDLSRNRTVGYKIGKGKSLEEICGPMNMVAEGVKTTKSAYHLAKKMRVEMPITKEVYKILYENKEPIEAVKTLMTRTLKGELEH